MKCNHFFTLCAFIILSLCLSGCSSDNDEGEPEIPLTEEMIILVSVAKEQPSVKLPLNGTVRCHIDWGDGHSENIFEPFPTHNYAGKHGYIVRIYGTVTALNSSYLNDSERSGIIGVYTWGKTGLTDMWSAFQGCTELTFLPADTQESFSDVTDFACAFSGCTGLKEISAGLFNNCTQVYNFRSVFENCVSLTEIPAGLFNHCTKADNFMSAFQNCESLTEIPAGLFNHCARVYNFSSAFENCVSLTKIPAGLFDNCTIADNFMSAFQNCRNLTEIPAGLFDHCTYAYQFQWTFHYCSSLTEIPAGLFDHCTQISSLIMTFAGCENLTGESPYTVINGNKVHLYERDGNTGAMKKPKDILFCFNGCTGLSDYADIPDGWK